MSALGCMRVHLERECTRILTHPNALMIEYALVPLYASQCSLIIHASALLTSSALSCIHVHSEFRGGSGGGGGGGGWATGYF